MNAIAQRTENAEIVNLPADPMVDMIQALAMNSDVSLERLQAMIAMKERHEDRQREEQGRVDKRAYFLAMAECQASIPVVRKTQRNDHTKSNYADLAAIEEQAMPIVHQHGFTVSFQPAGKSEKGDLRIKWTVAHSGGHVEQDIADIPMDGVGTGGKANMTGTQSFGSTASYGRRYLLCMLFNISTGDDNDGNTSAKEIPETITGDQYAELAQLVEDAGITEEIVCKAERVNMLQALPAKLFKRVSDNLKITIEKKKKAAEQ